MNFGRTGPEIVRTLSALRARPPLASDAHKGSAGRVLCVAGRATMPGAAMLVARAAQRAGAGLVTMVCLDRELLGLVPLAAPEAIYFDASSGEDWPVESRLLHARAAGPGLGDTPRTRAVVARMLEERTPAPLVLDADALNVFAGEPEPFTGCESELVITPHPGEARRLLGRRVPPDPAGRLEAALELSQRTGSVCCLKGSGTVVADHRTRRVFVCPAGNPGMATAGAGDVLTGVLVACLADTRYPEREWSTFDAAAWAVAVHALAGDHGARATGVRGLIASDLVAHLPGAEVELAGTAVQ